MELKLLWATKRAQNKGIVGVLGLSIIHICKNGHVGRWYAGLSHHRACVCVVKNVQNFICASRPLFL